MAVGEEGAPDEVRRHLALALDVDDLVPALRLARDLRPWFGTMKVGLELYSAAGPEAVTSLVDLGVDVFCDLKLHDIPSTVGRAARVIGALGARYLTVHAAGGPSMVRAGVEGLREGAARAGAAEPTALGVTVLTSEPEATTHLLRQRVAAGLDGGCQGFVCAAPDLATVRQLVPTAVLVTPGIRPEGSPVDDQGRVATPRAALDDGADLLVVGRPITRAADPVAAARALVASLA
jgi:orotidine-5'-phosphate decarboxylase